MANEVITGMLPGMPRRIPHGIETERLNLRCPRVEDGPELHDALVESVQRLSSWFAWTAGAEVKPEQSTASAQFARWRFLAGRELQFFIFRKGSPRLLGVAGLCNPDWSRRYFEISYWLRTGCEGYGYATEAVAALTDFAFRRLAARRLEIRCDPDNKLAAALPQRLGYRLEQILPRARRNHDSGQWRDVAVFVKVKNVTAAEAHGSVDDFSPLVR